MATIHPFPPLREGLNHSIDELDEQPRQCSATSTAYDLRPYDQLNNAAIAQLLKIAVSCKSMDPKPVLISENQAVNLALRLLRLDQVFTVCSTSEFEQAQKKVGSCLLQDMDLVSTPKKRWPKHLPVAGLFLAGLLLSSCKAGIYIDPISVPAATSSSQYYHPMGEV